MKKILIYLIKGKKKFATLFNDEKSLLNLKDLADITDEEFINNGAIPNTEEILERWEIKSAKIKQISKNRNTLKVTVDIDCKLLLRKTV